MIQPDTRVNTNGNDEHSVFSQLRRAGLIATPSRVAVLQVMSAGEMLDAPEIQRRLRKERDSIPLSSIYAALSRLVRAGLLVRRTYGVQKGVYGLANVQGASCVRCSRCGRIQWVEDARITTLIRTLCQEHGLRVQDYTLSIHAICEPGECAAAGPAPRLPPS